MSTWTIVTVFLLHRKPHSSWPGRLHLDWRPHTGTGDSQEVHILAHLHMSSFNFSPLSLLLFISHLPLTFLVYFFACLLQNDIIIIIILLFFSQWWLHSVYIRLPGLWYGVWSLTLLTVTEPNPLLELFFTLVCFLLWKGKMSSLKRVFLLYLFSSLLSLSVGSVWVNSHSVSDPCMPVSGHKDSGTCTDGGQEVGF